MASSSSFFRVIRLGRSRLCILTSAELPCQWAEDLLFLAGWHRGPKDGSPGIVFMQGHPTSSSSCSWYAYESRPCSRQRAHQYRLTVDVQESISIVIDFGSLSPLREQVQP
jgi:hypothetical protein